MSEAAVAERDPASGLPNSEAGTPALDPTLEVSHGQDDAETPETGAEETERTPDSYTFEELNEIYRSGKLTDPALVSRREDLLQRDQQSRQDAQRRLAEMQAADRQRLERATKADEQLQAELQANRQREIDRANARGEMPDLELIEERNQASLANYRSRMTDIVLEPYRAGLREALLTIYGDTPQNRQAVNARDVHDLISDLYGAAYQSGRKAGPGDDHVVLPKKDYEKEIAKAKREAADALKAANPSLKEADTGSRRAGGSTRLTKETYMAGSDAQRRQWLSERPDEVRALMKG